MAEGPGPERGPGATTADARFRRILHVLPAAARPDGVSLEELAEDLGVDRRTIFRDLEEVTARSLYLPAGPADDLQIQLTADRIQVWSTGKFTRPVKLLSAEALALALGLRSLAASGVAPMDGEKVEGLRRRLEGHLATVPTDDLLRGFEPSGEKREAVSADVPHLVFEAARTSTPCRIRYLKPSAEAPEERTLHPWVVARAEGRWYAVGRDPEAEDDRTRLFRLDRVLDAELLEGSFEVPEEFDVTELLDRGRLFDPDDYVEVSVRYSSRIARWIREKPWAGAVAESKELDDGSLLVRHRVADPRWIMSHVLQYGPDAEVLKPEAVRRRVRDVVEDVVGAMAG
ncbi:MAG: WYL domain-containing protein [Longimicrobiales bacterium]|nr:WYL domain-containing protein [Longimicrobiales bacterium]